MAELAELTAKLDDQLAPARYRPVFGGDLRFGLVLALGLGMTLGLRSMGWSTMSRVSSAPTATSSATATATDPLIPSTIAGLVCPG